MKKAKTRVRKSISIFLAVMMSFTFYFTVGMAAAASANIEWGIRLTKVTTRGSRYLTKADTPL